MALQESTCTCGGVWGWSQNEPSPITTEGCPVCNVGANAAMIARTRVACQEALEALLSRKPVQDPYKRA